MKLLLLLCLITFIVSKPQCCENCGSPSILEENDITESLEILGVDTFSLEHPCMNLPICSVSCDKEFGLNCDHALYYLVDLSKMMKFLTKCTFQNRRKVRDLIQHEITKVINKVKDPKMSTALYDILNVFVGKVLRICEEKKVPKTYELEDKWKKYLMKFPFFKHVGFITNNILGMSIYEYGNTLWKKAIKFWVQRCDCSSIFAVTDAQRSQAKLECLKKCKN